MRVLLDTTYAARAPYSGTAVYLERLCAALTGLQHSAAEVLEARNPRRGPPSGGGLGSVRNALLDAAWTASGLPRSARRQRADMIHHPLPALAPATRLPQVVTVHDLAFERLPERFDRRFRAYAHLAHRAAARRAAAVICVSETTAADARELWGIRGERIVVAPLGPGQELPALQPQTPRHFLYVGDGEPRKNLPALGAAYAEYRARADQPLELVLAGSVHVEPQAGLRVELRPDARRLAELYAGAAALVHPSLYEGFGMTPLESMRAGAPVLAARSPGVVEVCGEAALYADPREVRSFARQMLQIASDPALRADLAARGQRRAAQFSWKQCARRHLDAYSLALRG